VNWITSNLGTGSRHEKLDRNLVVIDVSDLVEGSGNSIQELRNTILLAAQRINANQRVVICCDKGIVRSNCIAFGVLISLDYLPNRALQLMVKQNIDVNALNLDLLNDILKSVKE
jgi:predicted protein tyrosine phosphatase